MTERAEVRQIVNAIVKHWSLGARCTKITLEKPLLLDGKKVFGWSKSTGTKTFTLGLEAGMSEPQRTATIAHEVGHHILNHLKASWIAADSKAEVRWEEYLCDLLGKLSVAKQNLRQ